MNTKYKSEFSFFFNIWWWKPIIYLALQNNCEKFVDNFVKVSLAIQDVGAPKFLRRKKSSLGSQKNQNYYEHIFAPSYLLS